MMSPRRVLVVDDEPEVRELLHDFLSSRGYEVVLVEGGLDALAALDAARPDVILLDVAMPGMDWVETLRRIVARVAPPPVIMVTANADVGVTSRLLALGAADYIPKPFDLDYLDQAVSIQVAGEQRG